MRQVVRWGLRRLLGGALFVTLLPVPCWCMDEMQLMQRLRAAAANAAGAADVVQTEIAGRLANGVIGARVDVASIVVSNIDAGSYCTVQYAYAVSLPRAAPQDPEDHWKFILCDWLSEAKGMETRFSPTMHVESEMAPWLQSLSESFHIIQATKSYQTSSVTFDMAVARSDLRDMRQGQKISGEIRMAAVSVEGSNAESVRIFGFLTKVKTESRMLRCPNGHEYAPSAGYRFCPEDGLPLK